MTRLRINHLFVAQLLVSLCVGCVPQVSSINARPNISKTAGEAVNDTDLPTKIATQTSLAQQLADQATQRTAETPPEIKVAFQAGIDLVRASGIEQSAKQVGDDAVDGELIGWDGKTFKLSELWREGPVVLMWYRGGWCSYCNTQLKAMEQSRSEIENAGARLSCLDARDA